MSRQQKAPSRSEWYFDDIPSDERRACFFYECSRSHPFTCEAILATRSDSEAVQGNNLKIRIANARLEQSFLETQPKTQPKTLFEAQSNAQVLRLIPYLCPEFPTTPWGEILPRLRKERLEQLADPRSKPREPLSTHRLLELARYWYEYENEVVHAILTPEPRTYALVRLDWDLSDKDLREQFNKFLEKRPPGTGITPKLGRKNSAIDSLHALAAWRVRKHYKTVTRTMTAIERKDVRLPYSDEKALRTAIQRMEKLFAEFKCEG